MTQRIDLNAMLNGLASEDAHRRDLAAAELTDLLEANCLTGGTYTKAVQKLLSAALTETDATVKEGLFNALSAASAWPQAVTINWDSVAGALATLDVACLEHGLVILGDSGNSKYRACIEPYLKHPDEVIRSTAAAALAELDAESSQPAKPQKSALKRS